MKLRQRTAFSLFQLLVVLAMLAILFGLFFPAILKIRAAANRVASINNLKMLGIACLDYASGYEHFPSGNDTNNFSAATYLLPFLEQDPLYGQLDFKKPVTDEKNAKAAATRVVTFLSPLDGQPAVKPNLGATNYLFSAGSKPGLADN